MRTLRASVIVECLKAVHLSSYVQASNPHTGGLFLVGPPGVMKSFFLEALDHYETAVPLTDVNTQNLVGLKSKFTNSSLRTLVMPEFQRIYERDPRTAAGVEGSLRALVEEGFRGASFEDSTIQRFRARATVIGAITDSFQERNWRRWEETGFARRFLWCLIRLQNAELLMESVASGHMLGFTDADEMIPMNTPPGSIPDLLTEGERRDLRYLVKKQPKPANVPYEMVCRIAAVLKYYYQERNSKRNHMQIVKEFGNCLLGGADIVGLEVTGMKFKQRGLINGNSESDAGQKGTQRESLPGRDDSAKRAGRTRKC